MSNKSDADKIDAVLEDLESWAEDEISHLERQFEARHRKVYLPYRVRHRAVFLLVYSVDCFCGIACLLAIAKILSLSIKGRFA